MIAACAATAILLGCGPGESFRTRHTPCGALVDVTLGARQAARRRTWSFAYGTRSPPYARCSGFDLTGVVATVDAMHTQTDPVELITNAGGDYAFTAKQNPPTLLAACKKPPWSGVPASGSVRVGHGRRVRCGKTTVAVVYPITSADHRTADPATPRRLGPRALGHRESRPLGPRSPLVEDASRTGAAPQAMASDIQKPSSNYS